MIIRNFKKISKTKVHRCLLFEYFKNHDINDESNDTKKYN